MKTFRTVILAITACIAFMSQAASAITTYPDTEMSWKNVSFKGRASATHCLLHDNNGIVWAGTNNGLVFYDGISTHQVSDPRLAGAQIYAMVEYDNHLYLGTNHGLLTLDLDTGAVSKPGEGTPKEIRCLLRTDNTLWIGSLYGVYTVDLTTGATSQAADGLPNNSTYSILRDSRGIIYVGTYDGLARWDALNKRFIPIKSRPGGHTHHNLFINSLIESNDGRHLYVGSEGGLYRYNIVTDTWESIPELDGNNIKSLGRVGDNHLLIGSDNGVYDLHNDTIRHYRHDSRQDNTLADNEIWCLLTDNDNNVWAGHERGFSISSHSDCIRTLRLSTLAHTGDGNEIHCIFRDSRGDLWLGGTNGVIRLPESGGARWYRHDNSINPLSHNKIRDINEDSDGNVWLSTDGGLNRYNRSNGQFDVFNIVDHDGGHSTNWVYTMDESDGMYWTGGFLGGVHGISKSKFDTSGGVIQSDIALNAAGGYPASDNHRLENDLVSDIVTDNDGNIWILLFRDSILSRYNPGSDTMTKFDINAMTGSYPTKICRDRAGRIWCAFNGGAVIFDTDGSNRMLRFAAPTEDEAAIAMSPAGDDVWISTYSNMWRANTSTLQSSILPIPQKAYTAIYEDTATGKVLLGGVDEILEVDPTKLTVGGGDGSISLILVNNNNEGIRRYAPGDSDGTVTIPYGGSLSLIVSSLDYSPEAVHRYMYRLTGSDNGSDDDWVVLPEGVNTIMFSDLRMGDYTLEVARAGMPADTAAIPVRVQAPWWLSWWAIIIYILTATGITFAIIAYFHRRHKRHFQEQERRKSLENVEKKLTFLSNISHDLKTPLSMIIGPVSLMKERTKDAAMKKSLDTVYDNAVRLNNLIHKTIELQHLEAADDSMLILSTFDVVQFCKSVFETFKENNPLKEFVFHSSCNELFIKADAVKFESVMTNLLSNACKYSDDGATISCGVSRIGDNVEIVVSDDGLGIEEADQPLVFQRMFRAPSTANLREGTGLGLYLIKRYLELMNGNINLYSRKGQGTSFIITLPISEKSVSGHTDTPAADDSGRPKILIVEDNTEISSFLADLLGKDFTMLTAGNGRAGLAIASSFQPDLVIADEMMPIMSGLEMCRRMKQIPRLASVPIIMLTAKSDPATENDSVRLGIDAFMSKPFDPGVLLSRIRQLIKSRDTIKEKVRIETLTETRPIEAESVTEKQLAAIARIIEENISDPDLNVNFLCEKSGMPQKQLYRTIKKYMGIAPIDYIRRVRLQKAAMLLSQKRFTVSEISYMVGFKTPSYFAKCFQAHYGVKPSQYKSDDDN